MSELQSVVLGMVLLHGLLNTKHFCFTGCTCPCPQEEEYEAWKVRELKRIKRDREEREK